MRDWDAEPFHDSLSSLALIGMRAAGADGYAFFEKLGGSGALRRLAGCGAPIPEAALTPGLHRSGAVAYPLRPHSSVATGAIDGILVFLFSDSQGLGESRKLLDQLAGTIATLWSESGSANQYLKLVERIGELETQLIDSKIADRARGFLLSRDLGSIETIARHVDRVLHRRQPRNVFEQLLSELEDEVEERRLLKAAKNILQSTTGITEEEAHAHLRRVSRRSRKRLRDAAAEVIENQTSRAS